MSLKEKLGEIRSFIARKREDMLLSKDLSTDPGQVVSGQLEAVPVRPEHRGVLEQFIREHHGDVARSLREDEIYAFGLYIERAFRAKGYAGGFLALTQKQLVELGYKRLYNAVAASNVPARRLYQTFGSKELGLRVSRSFFSTITFCGGRCLRCDPVWM